MAAYNNVASEATLIMQDALDRLRGVMTPDEATGLASVSLEDVEAAARDLDAALAQKAQNPNTAHLKHLLDALKRLQKLLAEQDSDPSFLPWLWAPVKRALEITGSTEKPLALLLAAYKRIATSVPDPDHTTAYYRRSAEGQRVLGGLYADILESHLRIYQVLCNPGWVLFFESRWDCLEPRLRLILDSIGHRSRLLRLSASADKVDALKEDIERRTEELAVKIKTREATELQNVHAWLKAAHLDQEDYLDEIQNKCHENTCDWIYVNGKIKSWLRNGVDHAVLWLKGKPGSGKSVLCSKLIEHVMTKNHTTTTMLYFFCSDNQPETKDVHSLLRGLVRQLIMKKWHLCNLLERDYVDKGVTSSQKQLRSAFRTLLCAFDSVRIIVDGLDECAESDQKVVIRELIALTRMENPTRFCKILIVSQDTNTISRLLQDRSVIDLNHEHVAVDRAITSFIRARVAQSPLFSNTEQVDQELLKRAEKTLLNKAEGMFLYVQLVITMLERAYSPDEVNSALSDLPEGLNEIYEKIILKILEKATERNSERIKRIFQWLMCSQRPIKTFELQDAVTLHPGNEIINDASRDTEQVFELCKPLVEVGVARVVRFVHKSVRTYLLQHSTWLDLATAQYHAAFSCLAYLRLGLPLIDSQYDEATLLIEVGKGFHGLCRYAVRYWLEHLLAYMDSARERPTQSFDRIVTAAENLSQLLLSEYDSDSENSTLEKRIQLAAADQDRLNRRLVCLENYHSLHKSARWTLQERLSETITFRCANSAIHQHPISKIKKRFDSLTSKLLDADEVPGLGANQLASFKDIFRSTMLVCRYANCSRALRGFATVQQRQEHEETHSKVYRCPKPECSSYRLGFKSPAKLKSHLEQHHLPEGNAEDDIPVIKPYGDVRNLTGVTLLGSPPADADVLEEQQEASSSNDESDEEKEPMYRHITAFAETDTFALGSTSFT